MSSFYSTALINSVNNFFFLFCICIFNSKIFLLLLVDGQRSGRSSLLLTKTGSSPWEGSWGWFEFCWRGSRILVPFNETVHLTVALTADASAIASSLRLRFTASLEHIENECFMVVRTQRVRELNSAHSRGERAVGKGPSGGADHRKAGSVTREWRRKQHAHVVSSFYFVQFFCIQKKKITKSWW